MSLYNNKKQKKLFHLEAPQKTDDEDCAPIKGVFKDFDCSNSYVLAQPSMDFNCIGWAIGVKEFIDPTIEINKHYVDKTEIGSLSSVFRGKSDTVPVYQYNANTEACKIAATAFFNEFKSKSVIPKKDSYVATDTISITPEDDTIAFFFQSGDDSIQNGNLDRKGFLHAARFLQDIDEWVSDVWSSKLGQYKLMTHSLHELEGQAYGHILCYLIPGSDSSSNVHDDL